MIDDDDGPVDYFRVYRDDPEYTVTVPPLHDDDPELLVEVGAAGGGTVGKHYSEWLWRVSCDDGTFLSGRDPVSHGTHHDAAVAVAQFVAAWQHDDTPSVARFAAAHGDRLDAWATEAEHAQWTPPTHTVRITTQKVSPYSEDGEWLEGDLRVAWDDGTEDVEMEQYGRHVAEAIQHLRGLSRAWGPSLSPIPDEVDASCWLDATERHYSHTETIETYWKTTVFLVGDWTEQERAMVFRAVLA